MAITPRGRRRQVLACLALGACLSFADTSWCAQIDGFTEPYRAIDLAASELGTLASVEVQEGDQVEVGQVVARLDEQVLKVALEIAAKNREAEGQLNAAMAELELQESRYEKLQQLRSRKHASSAEVERTAMQVSMARAQVQAVRELLDVKAMEYRRIEAELERRRVRSPIQGIVSEVHKDAGEFVSAAEPTVVRIVQLNPLLVVFSVPQNLASSIVAGDHVPVEFEDLEQSVQGEVEFVSPTADAQSGTVRVKVRVENEHRTLKSGLSCRLAIAGAPQDEPEPESSFDLPLATVQLD